MFPASIENSNQQQQSVSQQNGTSDLLSVGGAKIYVHTADTTGMHTADHEQETNHDINHRLQASEGSETMYTYNYSHDIYNSEDTADTTGMHTAVQRPPAITGEWPSVRRGLLGMDRNATDRNGARLIGGMHTSGNAWTTGLMEYLWRGSTRGRSTTDATGIDTADYRQHQHRLISHDQQPPLSQAREINGELQDGSSNSCFRRIDSMCDAAGINTSGGGINGVVRSVGGQLRSAVISAPLLWRPYTRFKIHKVNLLLTTMVLSFLSSWTILAVNLPRHRRAEFQFLLYFTLTFYLLYIIENFQSNTFLTLCKRPLLPSLAECVEVLRNATPIITYRVKCWHLNNRTADHATSACAITSFEVSEKFSYRRCRDCSDVINLNNSHQPFRFSLVKPKQFTIHFEDVDTDQRAKDCSSQLKEANRWRDDIVDLSEEVAFADFDINRLSSDGILCRVGGPPPKFLSVFWFLVATAAMLSWPYRLMFDLRCMEVYSPDVRKSISILDCPAPPQADNENVFQ